MANGATHSGGGSGGEEETAMTPIPQPSTAGKTAVPPAGNNQGCNSIDIKNLVGQILRQVLGKLLGQVLGQYKF